MTREDFLVRLELLGWVGLKDATVQSQGAIYGTDTRNRIYGPPIRVLRIHGSTAQADSLAWYFIVLDTFTRKFNKETSIPFEDALQDASRMLEEYDLLNK